MSGASAPDDLSKGALTQAWLAVSDDLDARQTGRYLHHQKSTHMNPVAMRHDAQARLMGYLSGIAGVAIF